MSGSREITFEFEQEEDGRWIAELPTIPGALCYGATKKEAAARLAPFRRLSRRLLSLKPLVNLPTDQLSSLSDLIRIKGKEYLTKPNSRSWLSNEKRRIVPVPNQTEMEDRPASVSAESGEFLKPGPAAAAELERLKKKFGISQLREQAEPGKDSAEAAKP